MSLQGTVPAAFSKTRVRKEVSWKAVGRAKQLQYMQTENFLNTQNLEME